jgi:hypothetical protein
MPDDLQRRAIAEDIGGGRIAQHVLAAQADEHLARQLIAQPLDDLRIPHAFVDDRIVGGQRLDQAAFRLSPTPLRFHVGGDDDHDEVVGDALGAQRAREQGELPVVEKGPIAMAVEAQDGDRSVWSALLLRHERPIMDGKALQTKAR